MFGITLKRIIIIVAILLLLAYSGKLGEAIDLVAGIVNWSKDELLRWI